MNFNGNCPRCDAKISPERMINGLVVCECGWSLSMNESRAAHRNEGKTVKGMVSAAVLIAGFLATSFFLNSPTGQVMSIRTKAQIGIATQEDWTNLAQYCKNANDLVGAEDALRTAFNKDKTNLNLLLQIAKLQEQSLQNEKAVKTYEEYLKLGGSELEVRLQYAIALERTNQLDKAISEYETLMIAQAGSVNVTATKGLINLYIRMERFIDAEKAIEDFKKKTDLDEFSSETALIRSALKKKTT